MTDDTGFQFSVHGLTLSLMVSFSFIVTHSILSIFQGNNGTAFTRTSKRPKATKALIYCVIVGSSIYCHKLFQLSVARFINIFVPVFVYLHFSGDNLSVLLIN